MPKPQTLEFLTLVWGFGQALDRASRNMLTRFGVTGRQRMTIHLLCERSGATPGDLARALRVDPSTMSGILSRLEREAFIERILDPSDRRSWRFQATAKGRAIERIRSGTLETAIEEMLASLPEEDLAATRRVFAALETALGEVREGEPARGKRLAPSRTGTGDGRFRKLAVRGADPRAQRVSGGRRSRSHRDTARPRSRLE